MNIRKLIIRLICFTTIVVVGREPDVRIEEQPDDQIPTNPSFAPFSVNIFVFPVKQ
jgi:hypothetical protein